MKARQLYISGRKVVFYGHKSAVYWRPMAAPYEYGPYGDTVQAVQSAINIISLEGDNHERQVTHNS